MARIRTIKPEFWTSAQVLECSPNARLLFIGLWNFCDDLGRHPDNPKQAKAEVFPADDFTLEDVRRMLDELSENGLIKRYVVNMKRFFHVLGWHHQRIDKPQSPKYPGPDQEDSTNVPGTLPPERKGKEGKGKESIGREGKAMSASPTANGANPGEAVERVFQHWKTTHDHPRSVLDQKRRKLIRDRLKDYSEADLCQAITGFLNSPHHMGTDPKGSGTKYDSIELFMRDSKHVDMGLRLYREPPDRQSTLTRGNRERTKDWVPPEMRRAANGNN